MTVLNLGTVVKTKPKVFMAFKLKKQLVDIYYLLSHLMLYT